MDILSSFSSMDNFRQLAFERMHINHLDIFGESASNFDFIIRVTCNNSFLVIVLGDFNSTSKVWHNSDKTTRLLKSRGNGVSV